LGNLSARIHQDHGGHAIDLIDLRDFGIRIHQQRKWKSPVIARVEKNVQARRRPAAGWVPLSQPSLVNDDRLHAGGAVLVIHADQRRNNRSRGSAGSGLSLQKRQQDSPPAVIARLKVAAAHGRESEIQSRGIRDEIRCRARMATQGRSQRTKQQPARGAHEISCDEQT
jgi:hypothetical protein